jgi:RNA recognition motif-containing protein
MHLYISNLSTDTTTEQIRILLSGYENISVSVVRTVRNAFTQATSTFAYVNLADDMAAKTLAVLNSSVLNGAAIHAQEAH